MTSTSAVTRPDPTGFRLIQNSSTNLELFLFEAGEGVCKETVSNLDMQRMFFQFHFVLFQFHFKKNYPDCMFFQFPFMLFKFLFVFFQFPESSANLSQARVSGVSSTY